MLPAVSAADMAPSARCHDEGCAAPMKNFSRSRPDIAAAGCPETAECVLAIADGVHAGARLPLRAGVHRVGGSLDNDVVVSEAALAACHFEIEHGGTTVLRTCGASLRLADGTALVAGGSVAVAGTLHFHAGGTGFRLVAAAPARSRTTRRLAAPVAALAACVAAVLVVSAPGAESNAALGRAPRVAERRVAAAPDTTEVAAALGDRLVLAGLGGLQPTTGGDGTVTVSGSLSPEQKAGWAEVRRWFDGRYGGGVVLVDHVGATVAMAPLSIAAVRPGGDAPFVIDQAGRRLFIGSAVADGWVVAAIEPTRVTVRRHAETLAVRF